MTQLVKPRAVSSNPLSLFRLNDNRPQTQPNKPEHIQLKTLYKKDAARLKALLTPEVCDNLAMQPILSTEQAEGYIHHKHTSQQKLMGVWHIQHGLIGCVGYCSVPGADPNTVFIHYWLSPTYQGRGYAGSALRRFLHVLQQTGLYRIYADVYRDNHKSVGLLKTCNFALQQWGSSAGAEQRPVDRYCLLFN